MQKQRAIKNLWIDTKYQSKYLVLVMIGIVGFMFTVGGLSYQFIESSVADAYRGIQEPNMFDFVLRLSVIAVVYMLFFVVLIVALTHKSAGAMMQFKKVIGRIHAGDLSARVQLRKKDDFQDVAEQFNQMMDSILAKQR